MRYFRDRRRRIWRVYAVMLNADNSGVFAVGLTRREARKVRARLNARATNVVEAIVLHRDEANPR